MDRTTLGVSGGLPMCMNQAMGVPSDIIADSVDCRRHDDESIQSRCQRKPQCDETISLSLGVSVCKNINPSHSKIIPRSGVQPAIFTKIPCCMTYSSGCICEVNRQDIPTLNEPDSRTEAQ